MVMRIGGLASGMDIDELVKKIMTAERAPLNKLFQKKTSYEWQRDAYRSVNTKIKTVDTYIADNLILKNLTSKTASSSNSDLVSAIATGKASGTLTIEGVSQLATAARGLGDPKAGVYGSTKLSTLFDNPESMPTEIKLSAINAQGKLEDSVPIKIDKDMTIDEFVNKINSSSAKVSAIFEGNRLSITAKNTGREINGKDAISTDQSGSDIFAKLGLNKLITEEGKNAVFQVNGIATERTSNSFTINGYSVTLKGTFNAERAGAEKYNASYEEWKNTSKQVTTAKQAKDDALNNYNTINSEYIEAKKRLFGTVVISDEDKKAFNKINDPEFIHSLNNSDFIAIHDDNNTFVDDTDYQAWLSDNTNDPELKLKLNNANISLEQFNALKSLDEDKLKTLSDQASYDTLGVSFLIGLSASEKSLMNTLNMPMTEEDFNNQIDNWKSSNDPTEKALGEKLNALNTNQKLTLRQLSSVQDEGMTELDKMTDVAIKYVDTNEKLAIKNLKENEYNLLVDRQTKAEADFKEAYKQQFGKDENYADTDYENANPILEKDLPLSSASPITLTSTTNVDDMMTKIKEFVTTYNGFIKDLNDQLKETKYRDYAPLTAEQKEGMSENQIKLWEEKAKSGLLRSDSLIREGLSNMRSLIYEPNPGIDSKYNSLFSIGITTSKNYNDGGTLEIDEEKLRKILEEDPDAVEKLFKNSEGKDKDTIEVQENGQTVTKVVDTRGFLQKLRASMKTMEINIEQKAGRSTMTDTQYSIGKSLKDTENRIDTWKRKLENIEARYWKQFSAMETAINKANSQSSIFAQGQ